MTTAIDACASKSSWESVRVLSVLTYNKQLQTPDIITQKYWSIDVIFGFKRFSFARPWLCCLVELRPMPQIIGAMEFVAMLSRVCF